MTERDLEPNSYTRLNIYSGCMPAHRHTFFEFLLVEDGVCLHSINGGPEIKADKRSAFLIRPTDYHHVAFASKETMWRDFYVKADDFKRLCGGLEEGLFDKLMSTSPYLNCSFSFDEFNSLNKKVSIINQILINGAPYPPELQVIYKSIIIDILVKFSEKDLMLKNDAPDWLNQLYLRMTYFNYVNLTIDEIVAKTNFSYGYITRMFKKYYGPTLVEYHNKTKIMYSVNLFGKMKIIDISAALGWENPKNYTTQFKKVYGMPPKKYAIKLRTHEGL